MRRGAILLFLALILEPSFAQVSEASQLRTNLVHAKGDFETGDHRLNLEYGIDPIDTSNVFWFTWLGLAIFIAIVLSIEWIVRRHNCSTARPCEDGERSVVDNECVKARSHCVPCEQGMFSSRKHLGLKEDAIVTKCTRCPPDEYQDKCGMSFCKECTGAMSPSEEQNTCDCVVSPSNYRFVGDPSDFIGLQDRSDCDCKPGKHEINRWWQEKPDQDKIPREKRSGYQRLGNCVPCPHGTYRTGSEPLPYFELSARKSDDVNPRPCQPCPLDCPLCERDTGMCRCEKGGAKFTCSTAEYNGLKDAGPEKVYEGEDWACEMKLVVEAKAFICFFGGKKFFFRLKKSGNDIVLQAFVPVYDDVSPEPFPQLVGRGITQTMLVASGDGMAKALKSRVGLKFTRSELVKRLEIEPVPPRVKCEKETMSEKRNLFACSIVANMNADVHTREVYLVQFDQTEEVGKKQITLRNKNDHTLGTGLTSKDLPTGKQLARHIERKIIDDKVSDSPGVVKSLRAVLGTQEVAATSKYYVCEQVGKKLMHHCKWGEGGFEIEYKAHERRVTVRLLKKSANSWAPDLEITDLTNRPIYTVMSTSMIEQSMAKFHTLLPEKGTPKSMATSPGIVKFFDRVLDLPPRIKCEDKPDGDPFTTIYECSFIRGVSTSTYKIVYEHTRRLVTLWEKGYTGNSQFEKLPAFDNVPYRSIPKVVEINRWLRNNAHLWTGDLNKFWRTAIKAKL